MLYIYIKFCQYKAYITVQITKLPSLVYVSLQKNSTSKRRCLRSQMGSSRAGFKDEALTKGECEHLGISFSASAERRHISGVVGKEKATRREEYYREFHQQNSGLGILVLTTFESTGFYL